MALSILQWNADGLRGHKDQLKNFLINSPIDPDIICIEETLMKENTQAPKIKNYNVIRKHCLTFNKGGLAIYIKIGLNFNVIDIEDIPNAEIQGVEIKTQLGYLKIYNIYLSPSHTYSKSDIQKLFINKRTLLVGDFNAHNKMWGCSYNNFKGNTLQEILTETSMVILNTGQATHITSNQSKTNSVIDLSICSQDIALNARHVVTNNNMGSNHFASITIINEEITIENNLSMHNWKLNKADWKTYKENSNFALNKDILNENNVEDKYNNIIKTITTLANETIPCIKRNYKNGKRKKHKPLPYWNDKCNAAIYKRNQYRNKMKKTRDLTDFMKYKQQEAVVKHTLKEEAKKSWQNYCSELTSQTKLGSVWNWARRMNGVATYSSIPTLKSNSLIAETNSEKANLLAHTYATVSSSDNYNEQFLNYIKDHKLDNNSPNIASNPNDEITFMNEKFNLNELKQAIKYAKNNKSPGEDRLPYELYKHLHKNAIKTLLQFCNDVWSCGILPNEWNHAIILPLLKPTKDPTSPASYRPISLTPTLCKIMEKMVTNRLQWYLEKNNIITKNQSGFRKYKNTLDQIFKLQDTILKRLKNKEHVLSVFIDFERAYDMLHVPTLLQKLQKLGIGGNIFNWISKFLSNRSFQVKVGTDLSNKLIQQNGTPQGSVISSLLFIIMINDIPTGPDGVNMSLFADDSAVYMGHNNIKILESKIQQSINIICNWCNKNGFKISISKTIGVLFTNKTKVPKINIKVNKQFIKMDNKVKFLGIIFDRKLNWQNHIQYIIEKCQKRLNLMRALTGYHWGASKKSLLAIYKALIRSILDYGDVVYSSAAKHNLNKLNTIQTEALRLCCGASISTAALALQNECGELPLHLRRLQNSMKFGAKIVGSKNHPCKPNYKPHWTDSLRTRGKKNYSLFYRTSDFTQLLNTSFIAPSFPPYPPWMNKKIKIDLSLKKEVNKKLDNPEYLKQKALEVMSKHADKIHIYTDGSKVGDTVSAAFTIPILNVEKKFRISNASSIYAAEMTAIKESVLWLIEHDNQTDTKYILLSDSLSVLTSLKENKCDSRPNLFNELLIQLNNLDHDKLQLMWIPSHVGLSGNEKADKLAKEALSINNIDSTNYLEIPEIHTMIKIHILNKWQQEYTLDTKGQFYKKICNTVDTSIKFSDPDRHREVQISRLRLGVANTNSRLFKYKKHITGLCDLCQTNDNIEHLLLECKRENISNILKDQCTLHKSEFNIKTLLGEGYLQRSVFRLVKLITKGKVL